jgi:hypothetical protein
VDGAGIRSAIDEHAYAASLQRRFHLSDALQHRCGCFPILTGKTDGLESSRASRKQAR